MKKFTFTGKLAQYERRNNSIYGNPKYYGVFENENGETLSGTTASDASCAYSFLNNKEANRTVTYHITRTDNTIIDYIEIEA